MKVKGYLLIDGKKCRVAIKDRGWRRVLTRRSDSYLGNHLEAVQAFLEQPGHRWLVEPLLYGVHVYLPMTVIVPKPPDVRRFWRERI
jgi:hypothetical protein